MNIENIDLEIAPNNKRGEEEAVPEEPNRIEPHIKVKTIHQEGGEVCKELAEIPLDMVPTEVPEPIAGLEKIPGVCRSTKVKFPAKPGCIPSMSDSSKYYAYAVTQLGSQRALHPDAQMFFDHEMCQEEPDIVAMH